MNKIAKGSLLGCGGLLVLFVLAVVALIIFSEPGHAPAHKFDSFRKNPASCIKAFDGRGDGGFTHIWILRSPDMTAWWDPNGLRAEAEFILDSDDPAIIRSLLSCCDTPSSLPNHVRTLREGRVYHVLLFNETRQDYAHLKLEYRSQQSDGSTTFALVTDFDGARPVKDCPKFSEFEKRWLGTNPTPAKHEP